MHHYRTYFKIKQELEDLKCSSDRINNVKIGQGQLRLTI